MDKIVLYNYSVIDAAYSREDCSRVEITLRQVPTSAASELFPKVYTVEVPYHKDPLSGNDTLTIARRIMSDNAELLGYFKDGQLCIVEELAGRAVDPNSYVMVAKLNLVKHSDKIA